MPEATVHITRIGDPPPLQETGSHTYLPNAELQFVILEGGMGSGRCSVAILVPMPDGRSVLAETSLSILSSVVIAARGAFPREFDGGPLHVPGDD